MKHDVEPIKIGEAIGASTSDDAPARAARSIVLVDLLRRSFPFLFLVVLIAVFSAFSSRFLSFDNLMTVLEQGTVLLVASLGMTFIIMAGSIDISVGSIVGIAALVAAVTAGKLGVWAIVPAVMIGAACGTVNGLLLALGKVPSFIATMGTMVVYRGFVLLFTRGAPVSIEDDGFMASYSGYSMGISHAVIVGLALALVAWVIINYTVFGREVRAIGGGERVSILTGIAVTRVKIYMYVLLGALCGIAGLLQGARTMAASAQLGAGLELDVIAAVVVGGTPLTGGLGSIVNTMLGVLIITLLSNGMNMTGVDPYLQSIIKGIVLICAVFITIDRKKIGIIK
ncbi:ABC transporter permease [Bradyrhizobium sp. 186]|uniref:ABC transporter permease n=1 Tax=Bradyrhizobium sp. 186 TaxID=2782654 RepID=UPI002001A1DC|nr:ABC transporter permease [Bradyrhizobium sp. 186]UPK37216.1 ABC transporter permease [Bradyrhizobium sp. 186]